MNGKKDKSRKWLVVMRKTHKTITNEGRSDVLDEKYAKFRANELMVIKIINVRNPKFVKKHVINDYCGDRMIYEVNKLVVSYDYDYNQEEICTRGIHYFKTMLAAYYYELPDFYTGHWTEWHDNGIKCEEGEYVNGNEIGKWNYWHDNGIKSEEGEYDNGNEIGKWNYWHDNGIKSEEGEYDNGNKIGEWNSWHANGEKVRNMMLL